MQTPLLQKNPYFIVLLNLIKIDAKYRKNDQFPVIFGHLKVFDLRMKIF